MIWTRLELVGASSWVFYHCPSVISHSQGPGSGPAAAWVPASLTSLALTYLDAGGTSVTEAAEMTSPLCTCFGNLKSKPHGNVSHCLCKARAQSLELGHRHIQAASQSRENNPSWLHCSGPGAITWAPFWRDTWDEGIQG